MYIFYQKHYQRTTPFWLNALVVGGIALRGGMTLAREILLPRSRPGGPAETVQA